MLMSRFMNKIISITGAINGIGFAIPWRYSSRSKHNKGQL
jgi:hypothetical protein